MMDARTRFTPDSAPEPGNDAELQAPMSASRLALALALAAPAMFLLSMFVQPG